MALTLNKIKRIRKAASQGLYVSDIDIMELCDLAVNGRAPSPEVEKLVEALTAVNMLVQQEGGPRLRGLVDSALRAYKEAQR